MPSDATPRLSLIVVAYQMPRALPRTLASLGVSYQRGIPEDDYDLLVVENGQPDSIPQERLATYGRNVSMTRPAQRSASPAGAVNHGVARTRGDVVGVWIDGARMATPGLLAAASAGMKIHERAIVATLGWHLGREPQFRSVDRGYDERAEDELLDSIGWPADGYRLFDVASLGISSQHGWFGPVTESNALFMRRSLWEELGGMEERFDEPGGGYVNLDLFRRACEAPGTRLVLLLGEGTFHQLHGGVAAECPERERRTKVDAWEEQYRSLRGRDFAPPDVQPLLFGQVPTNVMPFLERSLRGALLRNGEKGSWSWLRRLVRRA